MTAFVFHSLESAPARSRPMLEKVATRFGFVPGFLAGLAESPATLQGYLGLAAAFEQSSFSPVEQQVIAIAVSVENRCQFCVSAHSFIARNMAKMAAEDVQTLRAGAVLEDPRLQALAAFVRQVVRQRGWIGEADVSAFLGAGYTRAQILEVVLGVAMKTLSNYANHVLKTPLDSPFERDRWDPAV